MSSESKADDYVFDRSYIDNARLNLQHKLWTDISGYLLHPEIPTAKPDLKVADIGAGTGIWLTDLARQVAPTAQLDGFDISLDQAGPLEWFPPNVAMRQWDVMTDVPPDLIEKYDVVHLRLFVFVVPTDKGPKPILENLLKLLKPGGYLQWDEVDVVSGQQRKTSPSNPTTALDEIIRLMLSKSPKKMQPTWVKELARYFADVGLEGVTSQLLKASPRDSYWMFECNQLSYEMFLGKDDRMMKLFGQASREARGGVIFDTDRYCIVGRKEGGHVEG